MSIIRNIAFLNALIGNPPCSANQPVFLENLLVLVEVIFIDRVVFHLITSGNNIWWILAIFGLRTPTVSAAA